MHVHIATFIGGVIRARHLLMRTAFCLVTQLRPVVKSSRSLQWTRCAQPVPDLSNTFPWVFFFFRLFFFLFLHNTRAFWITYSYLFSLRFLGWHLTILSRPPDMYTLYTFFPLFLQSTRFNIWTLLEIVVMSQFLEQITKNVFWHLTKPVNCVILSLMLLGAIVQNSLWNPSVSLHSMCAALFSHE